MTASRGRQPQDPDDEGTGLSGGNDTPAGQRPELQGDPPAGVGPMGSGHVDERDGVFSVDESRIAVLLASEGRGVKALPQGSAERTPDAVVDDLPVEFKTLRTGAGHAAVNHALGSDLDSDDDFPLGKYTRWV